MGQYTRYLHLLHRRWQNGQKSSRFSHTLSMGVCRARGGSGSSEKGVHMYRGLRVRFANFIEFFLNIPWK